MKKLEQRVPNLWFKGFTDDWEQRKLGEIVTFFSGLTYHPTDIRDTGCFVVRSSNIQNQQIISADDVFVNNNIVNVPNVKLGDIIVVVRNGSRKLIGKHAQVLTKMPNTVIGAFMTGIRSSNNSYIEALLDSDQFKKEIHKNLGATINQITTGEFKKMNFVITTGVEAQQLGILFKQINNLISLQQRKLEVLKQLKKGLLQKMFADKDSKRPVLRFKKFHDNWERRKLIQVANYRNGRAHEKDINMNGNYIVVNSKFVSSNGRVKKFSSKLMEPLNKGEIAFVLSDVPNGKALARTFLVKEGHKYSLNQRIAGITPHQNISSYFLYILMNRNPYFLKFDDGVGQTNLSKKDVEQFSDHYPSGEEQQMIGKVFDELDRLITLQQQKLAKYQSIKKSLLQQMFI